MMQVPLSTAGKLIKVGNFKVSGIVYFASKQYAIEYIWGVRNHIDLLHVPFFSVCIYVSFIFSLDFFSGDTILKIDGTTVTPETISAHLVGSDVPGSTVRMTISHQGSIKDVSLKRMDSHVIAGKLKISELFTSMKEKALDSNVPEFADIVNKCIDSWKGDIVNEAEREAKQTYNFHLLQVILTSHST